MAGHGSKLAVYSAIGINALVTIGKLGGFFLTGSGAMLSEAVHSMADLGNQALLALGMQRGTKPADEFHPFGYGRDAFVWAMISATGIFFLGAGVTVAHGVHALTEEHPPTVESQGAALGILFLSLALEGLSFAIAIKGMQGDAKVRGLGLVQHLRTTDDPFGIAVLLEDSAAVIGVLLAFAAVGLSALTGNPHWDAYGSIAVGALLGLVAVFLITKNRALLIGPALPASEQAKLAQILHSDPAIEAVAVNRSVVTGPDSYKITAEIDFDGAYVARRYLEGKDVAALHQRLDTPAALQAFLEEFGEAMATQMGKEIDRIEERIRQEIPKATNVDLEPH